MIKIKLNPEEIKLLQENFELFIFGNDFNLVYQNQVPTMAFLLIEGQINLYKRKKKVGQIEPGTLIGMPELLSNHTIGFDCFVLKNSICILISKSALLENKRKNKHVHGLINQLLRDHEKKRTLPQRRI